MRRFGYTLKENGEILSWGYDGIYDNYIIDSDPFTAFDIENYKKDNGQWIKIETLDYPHAGRNIRVELTDAQITYIILNEQTRPLMEWAYHVPNRKTGNGLILWFVDFINTLMSEQDTEFLLKSLGAIITRKP